MRYIKTFLISAFVLLIMISPTVLAKPPTPPNNESIQILPVNLTYDETSSFIQSYIDYLSEPSDGTNTVSLTAVSNRPDGTVTYFTGGSNSFSNGVGIFIKPNIHFKGVQYYNYRTWLGDYNSHPNPFDPHATDEMSVTLYKNYLIIYDVNLKKEYDLIDLNVKDGVLYGTSRQNPSIAYLITLQKEVVGGTY